MDVLKKQDVIDVIEHVNDDHSAEMLSIAQVFVDGDAQRATLVDVNESGLEIRIESPTGTRQHALAFSFSGEAEDKILFLAYQAMVKQRKVLDGAKTRYLRFVERQTLTPHMLRLVFASDTPLPHNEPGYAFFFLLRTLRPKKRYQESELSKMPFAMRVWFSGILWVMKKLKPPARRKLLKAMYKNSRYYTLRATVPNSAPSSDHHIAWVDVFTHGQSPGGDWAKSLTPGDWVRSTADYREKTNHLHTGQALLIADETAMPSLAALLEQWKNPVVPVVIVISQDAAEQDYIDPSLVPTDAQIHRIVSDHEQLRERLLTLLESLPPIDAAWGALEQQDAKAVRAFLRQHHGLSTGQNRVRGYWQRDS
ncbi:MAG TPA: siderophore-interacting protein [Gammaproteobacteria bacterium]|jgi:NADPH-dependent ferric siderophore reductase|nr:siderophore-interacting protein [Gammaproteobacteria bacterium]